MEAAITALRRLSPRGFSALRECHRRAVAARYRGDLVALARHYGTDKWNTHWYAERYEFHLRDRRTKPLNLLEIGVGGYENPHSGGASLRMWKGYFTRGRVYGVDIHDKTPLEEPRIRVFRGGQADADFMAHVFEQIGRVDVLVDDGSHVNTDVLATFRMCFPLLADDGIYAIEDVQTSYWPEYGGHPRAGDDLGTVIGFFKQLSDGLNRTEMADSSRQSDALSSQVSALHFYHNLIIVEKGDPTRPRRQG